LSIENNSVIALEYLLERGSSSLRFADGAALELDPAAAQWSTAANLSLDALKGKMIQEVNARPGSSRCRNPSCACC
jgi:hypothetical protein